MTTATQRRHDQILAQVYEHGRVAVKALAGLLEVSEATVRRDLKALSDRGQVELVYGGAVLRRSLDYSFRSKSLRNVEAKRAIGSLAADLVGDHEQVFIDSGTTCFELALRLKRKRGLSIVVNSARLALELDARELSVIMLGGQYRPERMDTIGPLATASLDQLRGYIAFIGADGLSMDFGLTASDIDSAHLYRLAVRHAREAVLVVDHSKFTTPSLFKIVDFDAISRLVTDRQPSPEWLTFLNRKNIDVLWPDAGGGEGHPPADPDRQP
jgi:DeoR/GlpR family transcriptional regulator of sugar metabolism